MTLEKIENDIWYEPPKDSSSLVKTCYRLRKIDISELEIEDLRILIGQNISLKVLIPIALKILENNILAEGDYYEGDLLKSVLTSDLDYWKLNPFEKSFLRKLIVEGKNIIINSELNKKIKNDLIDCIDKF